MLQIQIHHTGGGKNPEIVKKTEEYYEDRIKACERESEFVVNQNIQGNPLGEDQEYLDDLNNEKYKYFERLNRLRKE